MGSSSNRYAPRLPQPETKSSTKQVAPTDPILGPENLLKTGFAQKGLPSDSNSVLRPIHEWMPPHDSADKISRHLARGHRDRYAPNIHMEIIREELGQDFQIEHE